MKLLIVDYLDSYSHNIPSFLRQAFIGTTNLEIDIEPYTNLDEDSVRSVVASYHGVVLSAGPGTVECEKDLGSFTPALLSFRPAIPVYGICLGFQAICKHFGGSIHRLSTPHHGLVSHISSVEGVPLGRKATRYHSLEAQLDEDAQRHLELLAIANNHDGSGDSSVMEVRHRTLPFWGVQYHPESIYSSGCGVTVQPFLLAAESRCAAQMAKINGTAPSNGHSNGRSNGHSNGDVRAKTAPDLPARISVAWKSTICQTNLLDLLPMIQREANDFVLLDSSSKGQWDILAAADTASLFRYSVREQRMSFTGLRSPAASGTGPSANVDCSASLENAWTFLTNHSAMLEYTDGPSDVPFWGGFVGYFGYELGLAELGLDAHGAYSSEFSEHGDIQLLWSTETLVYNKKTNELYAISLNQDSAWVETALEHAGSSQNKSSQTAGVPWSQQYKICHPDGQDYIGKIQAAQEEIKAGNSYELCLTAPSTTQPVNPCLTNRKSPSLQNEPTLRERFQLLRQTTPAEFMSLIKLGGVEMLSASPEEFLSYNAQTTIAQMKPIKGTLPKKDAMGNPISHQAAYELLHEPKVIAENLMIVDLVRHDLAQVSSKVTCPDLMRVDDIGPMYQLVSTVQAEVKTDCTAWDLIRHSLPPGSMTGAPKRRSCEILQRLEEGPRGLYSGITGYIDVRGHCRTSVNIRNMVKYPGESSWRIGAGGAITSLSDPVDEWHERQLKAASVCRSLVPSFSILETLLWDPKAGGLVYWNEHFERLLSTVRAFGFDLPTVPKHYTATRTNVAEIYREMHESTNGKETQSNGSSLWQTSSAPVLSTNGTDSTTITSEPGTDGVPLSSAKIQGKISRQLYDWTTERVIASNQQNAQLRLSLAIDVAGTPSINIVPIPATATSQSVTIRLDPCAVSISNLEPFVIHKTTNRAHYTSARDRAGVEGRDEVLMFRPDHKCEGNNDGSASAGADTDWLTEGSYTNVAIWDDAGGNWRTPSTGCLPGIMRQKLVESGQIVIGDLQRRDLTIGAKMKLFNSVRGVFEGVIVA